MTNKKRIAAAIAETIKPAITKQAFILTVEQRVRHEELSYTEAILSIAAECEIEPEDIATFVDGSIKDKLQVEAQSLNNLPRSSTATIC
jgi:hypothetical protein